jgi:hypothetical protein
VVNGFNIDKKLRILRGPLRLRERKARHKMMERNAMLMYKEYKIFSTPKIMVNHPASERKRATVSAILSVILIFTPRKRWYTRRPDEISGRAKLGTNGMEGGVSTP